MFNLTIHKKDGMNNKFHFKDGLDMLTFINEYIGQTMTEKGYMEMEFTLVNCQKDKEA